MTDLDSWRALAAARPGMAIYPEAVASQAMIAADVPPPPAEGCGHPHDSDRLSGYVSRECARDWCERCDDPACDCPHHPAAAEWSAAFDAMVAVAWDAAFRREAAEIAAAERELRRLLRADPTRLRIRRMHSRYPHRRPRNA